MSGKWLRLVSGILGALQAGEDWTLEANARIHTHRMADLVVRVPDAQPGVPVRVELIRHAFLFGTAVTGDPVSEDPYEVGYRRNILEDFRFSGLVSENDMKWYSLQEKGPTPHDFRRADAWLAFAHQHELQMRGHALFWAKEKFVPAWVRDLPGPDAQKQAVTRHLETTVNHFRDQVVAWDVNNEMLDGSWYADALGPAIRSWMFTRTHELDPEVPLFVNEYSILGNPERVKELKALIQSLRDQGADVGGIGVQEHAAERLIPWNEASDGKERPERAGMPGLTPEEMWASLDALAETGLPVHLTEISALSRFPDRRADALETLFRVGFAHPSVEAILLWGFSERRHWLGKDAALVDAGGQLLEPGRRLSALLTEEWHTAESGVSDAEGCFRFRGFKGTYEVTIGDHSPVRMTLKDLSSLQ